MAHRGVFFWYFFCFPFFFLVLFARRKIRASSCVLITMDRINWSTILLARSFNYFFRIFFFSFPSFSSFLFYFRIHTRTRNYSLPGEWSLSFNRRLISNGLSNAYDRNALTYRSITTTITTVMYVIVYRRKIKSIVTILWPSTQGSISFSRIYKTLTTIRERFARELFVIFFVFLFRYIIIKY